jgi:ribosomal protein S18 acetylase RimI-like enzyme
MIENMKVEFGRTSDIDSWMRLVRKVSWNFPGLETEQSIDEHRIIVLKFMNDKRALCVKNEQEIVGVLLYSRKYNMICCLAVDPAYRKRGIASLLLREAIDKLDRDKDITVSTFRENDVKGIAPRKLYKKFGLEEGELIEEFGYPNQRFVLHADKSADNVIIGATVTVTVDRPLGSYHPEYKDMYYPINYGYIEGVMAPDGEEQDAYILGVNEPVGKFTGKIIAIVYRKDDIEEKWVVVPDGVTFSKEEIRRQIHFQKQYFDSEIVM